MQNRSYLFVPATRADLIPKAIASGADVVVVDWEDAVAADQKAAARRLLAEYDRTDGRKVWLRINAPLHAEHEADLQAAETLSCLNGLIIPKAESSESVEQAARRSGLPVMAAIETARGWQALQRIARAQGLSALTYGSLDLANDLNLKPNSPAAGDVFNRLRTDLLLHSTVNGLQAPIASVYADFKNEAGLRTDIAYWRDMGFGGMLCIHPSQVPIVHQLLHPGEQELDFARRVCNAADHTRLAAFQLDGQMIDAPVIAQSRRLLQQYGQ